MTQTGDVRAKQQEDSACDEKIQVVPSAKRRGGADPKSHSEDAGGPWIEAAHFPRFVSAGDRDVSMEPVGQGCVQALVGMHEARRGKEYRECNRGAFVWDIEPEASIFVVLVYARLSTRGRTKIPCFKHLDVVVRICKEYWTRNKIKSSCQILYLIARQSEFI
jgi:hypothetical protein